MLQEDPLPYTLETQCVCDKTAVMKGGFCYKQYTITDAKFSPDNSTITFLNCGDLIRSAAKIEYSINLTKAATISLMPYIDCNLVDFSISGFITTDGTDVMENHIYGLGD